MIYARGQRVKILPDQENGEFAVEKGRVLDNLGGGLYYVEKDNGECVEIDEEWLELDK